LLMDAFRIRSLVIVVHRGDSESQSGILVSGNFSPFGELVTDLAFPAPVQSKRREIGVRRMAHAVEAGLVRSALDHFFG